MGNWEKGTLLCRWTGSSSESAPRVKHISLRNGKKIIRFKSQIRLKIAFSESQKFSRVCEGSASSNKTNDNGGLERMTIASRRIPRKELLNFSNHNVNCLSWRYVSNDIFKCMFPWFYKTLGIPRTNQGTRWRTRPQLARAEVIPLHRQHVSLFVFCA